MWLTGEEEFDEFMSAMRDDLAWAEMQRTSMQRAENRRSRLGDVTRRYEILYIPSAVTETLHYMTVNEEKFSCVQELMYRIPNINVYNLHNTLLVRRMLGIDIANVFHVADDFTVHWLGFVDMFVLDQLRFVFSKYQYRMGDDEIRNAFRIRLKNNYNTTWLKPTTKTIL